MIQFALDIVMDTKHAFEAPLRWVEGAENESKASESTVCSGISEAADEALATKLQLEEALAALEKTQASLKKAETSLLQFEEERNEAIEREVDRALNGIWSRQVENFFESDPDSCSCNSYTENLQYSWVYR
jgi:hypothetical protein